MANVYAWEPLNQAGQPDRFLGDPILTYPNMPVPAASAGVTAIFFDPQTLFLLVQVARLRDERECVTVDLFARAFR